MTGKLRGIARIRGTVRDCDGSVARVAGLSGIARIGDGLLFGGAGAGLRGEVIALEGGYALAALMGPATGLSTGADAWIAPDTAPTKPAMI